MQRHQSRRENVRRTALAVCSAAGLLAAMNLGCSQEKAAVSRPIIPSVSFNKPRAAIGSPVEITYRFEVGPDSEAVPKDYHVFVHFLDSHDSLLFTDDHRPPEPTSSWQPGSTQEYTRTLFIPLYPYLGTASVKLGLYVPETAERLGLSGPDDGNQGYQVAQIQLLDQKENIFLVYKEGWHQLESQPENRNVEWQWTKKEAVCSFRNPKRDATLFLEADTNTEALSAPLQVAVWIGQNEVASFPVEGRDPILKKIAIPASALGGEDWVDLRLVNSESFVPSAKNLGTDDRELGLRVYHLYVDSVPSGT